MINLYHEGGGLRIHCVAGIYHFLPHCPDAAGGVFNNS
jgi:hypothetical protein